MEFIYFQKRQIYKIWLMVEEMSLVGRTGGILNTPTLSFSLSVARLLLPKHSEYRQKDSCFVSKDCSRHSGPSACSPGIIWHFGIPNTRWGCIPKQYTLNYLCCAHKHAKHLSANAHKHTENTQNI